MSRHLFGWDLPPGVSQRDIDEAYGVEEPEDIEEQERKAMTEPSISAEDYEDLHAQLYAERTNVQALSEALHKLQKAAQEVVNNRDTTLDELQGFIMDLEEAIPCDCCLQAPCVCPD